MDSEWKMYGYSIEDETIAYWDNTINEWISLYPESANKEGNYDWLDCAAVSGNMLVDVDYPISYFSKRYAGTKMHIPGYAILRQINLNNGELINSFGLVVSADHMKVSYHVCADETEAKALMELLGTRPATKSDISAMSPVLPGKGEYRWIMLVTYNTPDGFKRGLSRLT